MCVYLHCTYTPDNSEIIRIRVSQYVTLHYDVTFDINTWYVLFVFPLGSVAAPRLPHGDGPIYIYNMLCIVHTRSNDQLVRLTNPSSRRSSGPALHIYAYIIMRLVFAHICIVFRTFGESESSDYNRARTTCTAA